MYLNVESLEWFVREILTGNHDFSSHVLANSSVKLEGFHGFSDKLCLMDVLFNVGKTAKV